MTRDIRVVPGAAVIVRDEPAAWQAQAPLGPWDEGPELPLRLGVSTCLLGHPVRYDGGHSRDRHLLDLLGPHVEWWPVCPEMAIGMGSPRPAIRLVHRDGRGLRLELADRARAADVPGGSTDLTDAMHAWTREASAGLASARLAGFVLKKNSPSCGLERVKRYDGDSPQAERVGTGLWAARLQADHPGLPLEEEGRLTEPRQREQFATLVFLRWRWMRLEAAGFTLDRLMRFHAHHKLLLMSRRPAAVAELGRLLASATRSDDAVAVAAEWIRGANEAMRTPPSPGRHVNALQHAAGYVTGLLDDGDRKELTDHILAFGDGRLPLVVPITLLRHHVRRLGIAQLAGQVYLEPHPRELMLLNQV